MIPRLGFHENSDAEVTLDHIFAVASNPSLHPLAVAAYIRMAAKPPGWKPTRKGIAQLLGMSENQRGLRKALASLHTHGYLSVDTLHKSNGLHGTILNFHPYGDGLNRKYTHILEVTRRGRTAYISVCRHGKEMCHECNKRP